MTSTTPELPHPLQTSTTREHFIHVGFNVCQVRIQGEYLMVSGFEPSTLRYRSQDSARRTSRLLHKSGTAMVKWQPRGVESQRFETRIPRKPWGTLNQSESNIRSLQS
ncbi:hypothetical protein AVEN_84964-1 [Araneus ventricosus]|uniref:Uncharacterized protein n=1 Tax=Araneus ventricosus TaxID=182803 RepID=A0A4Y2C0Y7_ARAVE|nr:hypothetical protein AVEN_84964-1 [Araneus ventricosus]